MLRAGKRTHRLGFYRGITYRDRCECNKGGRKIADEWKLLGYECYKRGLRERELVGQSSTVVRKKSQSPRPRAPSGPLPDVDLGACAGYVKGGTAEPAPSPPKEETKTEAPPAAIELPPARKLAPRVPTPDPSKPFAAGGFQAFKRKWQAQQQQQKPAVTVSGAFAPQRPETPEASWPTLDGRPAPELPESRRAQETGYDPRTEPLLPGDWRCALCGRPNIRRRDACASRRCRGRRPAGHTGEDAYQRALRESREADQRRQEAEDDELERALAASRAESQPSNDLMGPSSYGGGAFGSGGTNGFGGSSPRAASPVLGGGLYGGAFSSDGGTGAFSAFAAPADGGGGFGGPATGAFAEPRVSVGARARARAAARADGAAAQQTTPEASRLLAAAAQPNPVSPTSTSRALAAIQQPPPSSTGWVTLTDPTSGRTYYEHAGRGLTTWEKPAELEDDDADLRAALAASAAVPPPVDEDAELQRALALSAREQPPPAPPAMDDDAELRAVLALSAREASQQPVQQDDDLARALAASLQETRRPVPTDISSVLAAAGLSRHLPLFRREEIESVEDLRYLSVDDFVAIGLERAEAQDLSRMCATVAV